MTGMIRFLFPLLALVLFASSLAAAQDESTIPLAELRQRAEDGDPEAQYNLGLRYAKGNDAPQDDQLALSWYLRAAENHHPLAQNNLGAIYEQGRGVAMDHAEAVRWYRLAAEQDQPYAQNSLAIKLFKGEGVERDPVMAYVWMRLAATQGYEVAVRNAELIYRSLSPEEKSESGLQLDILQTKERQTTMRELMGK